MAQIKLKIDAGSIEPTDLARDVPKERWKDLLSCRKDFLALKLPYDCRCLLQFVDEADEMWADLGYTNLDDLLMQGYGLEPNMVNWAISGLKQLRPDEPIPYKKAIALGKHGGDRKSEEFKNQGDNVTLKDRGNKASYLEARLRRDHPEIHQDLLDKKYPSTRQAGIAAGIVKVDSPLEAAWKAVKKLNDNEIVEIINRCSELLNERSNT